MILLWVQVVFGELQYVRSIGSNSEGRKESRAGPAQDCDMLANGQCRLRSFFVEHIGQRRPAKPEYVMKQFLCCFDQASPGGLVKKQ